MKFYANKLNGNFLRNALPDESVQIDWVRAAIAYGSDETTLVENCVKHGRRLDIWMRYDHTVPVDPRLLRFLLRNSGNNIFCFLIPDVLHAKVIWWKNYGVYIGSANLTDRAWVTNIEFGVFIPEQDLEANGQIIDIEGFFESLISCDAAQQLTEEIIQEQERILRLREKDLQKIERGSESLRSIKRWEGPAFTSSDKAFDIRKESFIKEWRNGLSVLRDIAEKAPDYRPRWLSQDVPAAWQADQFLHAFYYNKVVDGVRHPYDEHYQKNRKDPTASMLAALKWWSELDAPPSSEDVNCHVRAPVIRRYLEKNKVRFLSLEEFSEVLQANHSTVDHVRRMRLEELGLREVQVVTEAQRVNAFAKALFSQKNERDETVLDILAFVLDGGSPSDIPARLFEVVHSSARRFPHFGNNQIAELAGWARPELCPPRNGRTSKGLRALGYDVHVY
ncbi:phosphatidylserine/phosphatidylglycerophosphate/cardiolipin synthase family protein [Pseudomonas sp. SWRI59]|uniref:phospholipase D family protein n=1 Tax=unclassified Pseudomonas TaxID=196821 RepID=UPI0016440809|nr:MULTISPECIES: phospholipase D family protein [unclassified Pseudomonas]MBC3503615.1 phosphatidylserine/phosphatidylglycerophosphate/cardiolipin synthase family protein [Pseudomonas sp. SWRI59]MBC3505002.1 phosphatidylserine/phosphatidylglycerophosphate/cardiolipin synthase family protein [Pseudomonas sp. SWRI68]